MIKIIKEDFQKRCQRLSKEENKSDNIVVNYFFDKRWKI